MPDETKKSQPHIGTLNESSLHAALKLHYECEGDASEAPVDGYVVDLLRLEKNGPHIIEIQTTSFASMKKKLNALLETHTIRIVYPVPIETTLLKPGKTPRKSPKKGNIYSIFSELVSITDQLKHPNLSFDVVLVSINKLQEFEKNLRRNRGGYRTVNTELVSIHEIHHFCGLHDLISLLPDDLPEKFTTADIAQKGKIPRNIAQQMAYCFRKTELIAEITQSKSGKVYERVS